jgi:8-oxo-dGTP pyrophosphatase MutT (NUDIX family)
MTNGTVLALDRLDGDVLHVRPAGYFDRIATGDALLADPALRERAERLAGGDPLRRGTGRGAAVGVSTIATVRAGDKPALVLGRRDAGLPMGAGEWHVVPAGMLEPDPADGDAARATAATELREELGVPAPAPAAFSMLGLGWDLGRLLPEVCLRVDLHADGAALVATAPRTEHAELRLWPLDDLAALWAAHPPGTLSPAGAAAIALLEATGA